jgi:hypothetical protein
MVFFAIMLAAAYLGALMMLVGWLTSKRWPGPGQRIMRGGQGEWRSRVA